MMDYKLGIEAAGNLLTRLINESTIPKQPNIIPPASAPESTAKEDEAEKPKVAKEEKPAPSPKTETAMEEKKESPQPKAETVVKEKKKPPQPEAETVLEEKKQPPQPKIVEVESVDQPSVKVRKEYKNQANSDHPATLIYLVDISGSMNATMQDGKTRIEVAKNAIQVAYAQMIQR